MTIVVTGASGSVGRAVLTQLAAAGEPVRAITRHPDAMRALPPGVEVFQADLLKPETLAPALRGARRLFLFPVPETACHVVDLAHEAGVGRIVVLSSGAVTYGYDTSFHPPVERAVEESGLEWTHVRPGEFAANKLRLWGPSIRAQRAVLDPYPEQAGSPIHEADIAAVAVVALLRDGHAGKAYTMTGPARLTHRDQVRAIEAAIGEEITIRQVTPEEAREYYRRQGGWAAANADFLLGFQTYSGGSSSGTSSSGTSSSGTSSSSGGSSEHENDTPPAQTVVLPQTVEQITGRPARTFQEWARDHAQDFR